MAMSQSRLSVLITNYNTWPLTSRCVREFDRWSGDRLAELVVIDDHSEQPAPEDLPAYVRVIRNSENRGFVASVNQGFALTQGEIVLLFDSDAYPLMDLAEQVERFFQLQPQLGVLGFSLVGSSGKPSCAGQPEPDVASFLLGQKIGDYWLARRRLQIRGQPVLYSCALAVRRAAFQAVGGFDEQFDWLDVDLDFSMRVQAAGWDVRIDPNLRAFHEGGGAPQSTSQRVFRFHKNRWRLLAKHGRITYPWLLKLGLGFRHALEYAVFLLLGRWLCASHAARDDKLQCRRRLLIDVWTAYGNEGPARRP
jgi:GT2 family glycosyltransferase